jgi:hypothetical protein
LFSIFINKKLTVNLDWKVMKKLLALGLVFASISACAEKPENIAPAYVSPTTYQALSCKQLRNEAIRVDNALAQKSAQQQKARNNDTVGVILIGLPTSSLSGGNVAAEIAALKGQKKTLEQSQNQKNCF